MSEPARGPARWWRLGVFTLATLLAVVVGVRNLESNGRGVVIRAYARMERALARSGTPRAASETPQEFVRRALTRAGAGATPARHLTDLFEQARFSTHPVDREMRSDASQALRVVRDELGQ